MAEPESPILTNWEIRRARVATIRTAQVVKDDDRAEERCTYWYTLDLVHSRLDTQYNVGYAQWMCKSRCIHEVNRVGNHSDCRLDAPGRPSRMPRFHPIPRPQSRGRGFCVRLEGVTGLIRCRVRFGDSARIFRQIHPVNDSSRPKRGV